MKTSTNQLARFSAILAITSALLISCSSEPISNLDKLIHQRDSLKEVRSEIENQITAINIEIEKRDSTQKGKLVTTVAAIEGDFRHYFEVYGNVESDKAATLFAESQGVVNQIAVKEGDRVQKGQVLLRLDGGIIDKNIAELKTSLDLAETLFEKQKRLWDQNIGSEVQYLEAKNRKESLENSLATLREQGSKSVVRAPFEGVVDKIFPKLGEMAGMQMPVVRVVNLDNLYITADVSEKYIDQLSQGDEVKVMVNRKDTLSSKISRIGKYINATNRSFEMQVNIEKAPASLMPNSLVALKINDQTDTSAVVISSSLILQDGEGRDYVYVVGKDDNEFVVAKKRLVKTGLSYEGKTVVASGLVAGDKVIDKGSRAVRDGDRIEITTI